MATIISAGTTTGTALNVTPDTSGNLAFQTGAGANTITVPNTTGTLATTSQLTRFKNRIINGDMRIDQRNAGASVTIASGNTYTLDRWVTNASQSSKFSVQQSSSAPTGFSNSLLATSLSAYSVGASDYFLIRQKIEGFNTADLAWGTANAKIVTLSFWVNCSLTGTFGGSFFNSAENRFYPFTYTVNVANTWEQKIVTLTGDLTGTWVGSTNGIGVQITFGLGAGSNYTTTTGSWTATTGYSATGATSVVGTNGATFYITGVQLEVGSAASAFEYVDYTTQLAMCQRYYETAVMGLFGSAYAGSAVMLAWRFAVTKRTTPTVTNGSAITIWDPTTATYAQSSPTSGGAYITTGGVSILTGNYSGLTTYRPYITQAGSESTALTASAEL